MVILCIHFLSKSHFGQSHINTHNKFTSSNEYSGGEREREIVRAVGTRRRRRREVGGRGLKVKHHKNLAKCQLHHGLDVIKASLMTLTQQMRVEFVDI